MCLVRVVRVPGRGVDRSGTAKVEHEDGIPGGKEKQEKERVNWERERKKGRS